MAQINKASVNVGRTIDNSKVTGGEIHNEQGKDTQVENDVSVTVGEDVTGSSEVEGGKIYNSSEWTEVKVEVQKFLEQLAQNPITSNEAVATEAVKQEIKKNITLKQRLLNGLKAGGTEALIQIFQYPGVSISVETIKGFLEAG